MNPIKSLFREGRFQLLGTALFSYMLMMILMLTLAPFRYNFSLPFSMSFFWGKSDIFMNVLLFMPVGFLLPTVFPGAILHKYWKAAMFGVCLSFFIELNQIFIESRDANIVDIISNGSGTIIGAIIYKKVKHRINEKASGLLILEIPVMNILFLLIPLLWINGREALYDESRFFLLLILGLIGVILLTETYKKRIKRYFPLSDLILMMLVAGWYFVGTMWAFKQYPLYSALLVTILMAVTYYLLHIESSSNSEKRFELNVLKKIFPLFTLYLLLLSVWPVSELSHEYKWSLAPSGVDHSLIDFILYVIKHLSSFTLIGYMLYQFYNRKLVQKHKLIYVIMSLFLIVLALEIPRGFNTVHYASVIDIFFSFFWGMFGAMIYILQLQFFKTLVKSE